MTSEPEGRASGAPRRFTVVGMGPGDGSYVLPAAEAAIAAADLLIGDERHLARYPGKPGLPFKGGIASVLDRVDEERRRVALAVLVSGDPCLYSLGRAVARRFAPCDYELVPGLSSVQLACARARVSWDDAVVVSVHGRPLTELERVPYHRSAAILTDAEHNAAVAAGVLAPRLGALRRCVVAERLGYADERIVEGGLGAMASMSFGGLAVMVLPVESENSNNYVTYDNKEEVTMIGKRSLAVATACAAVLAGGVSTGGSAADGSASVAGGAGGGGSGRQALLVVSFGTSYEETLEKTIAATERSLAAAYPDYELRRAFTSGIVIRVLAKRGVMVDDVPTALGRLRDEGYERVVIQPLHLIPGVEYHEVLSAAASFRGAFAELAVGEPLLSGAESYFELARALEPTLPSCAPGEAVVFMGHGTHHAANAAYPTMQRAFDDLGLPAYVGTVEGYPELPGVMRLLKRDGVKKVTLLPLMLVAGDHATNDMAGDEDDSWKNVLTAEGFEVECVLRGLGERASVRGLYAAKAGAAMESLAEATKK